MTFENVLFLLIVYSSYAYLECLVFIVYLLRLGGSALCQPKRMGLILGATSSMSSNLAVSPNTRCNIHLLIVYSSYAYLECLVFIVYLLDFLHCLGGLAFVSPKECV